MKAESAGTLANVLRDGGWAVALVGPEAMKDIGMVRVEVESKLEDMITEMIKSKIAPIKEPEYLMAKNIKAGDEAWEGDELIGTVKTVFAELNGPWRVFIEWDENGCPASTYFDQTDITTFEAPRPKKG